MWWIESEAFPISDDSWNLLLDAVLNSFHGFRCGCTVPGSHDACHLDTFVEYKGDKRCMAGGWHDAANNTEFADSTHLSIYVLLRLYEQLIVDPQQAMRAQAFLEEAKWGLDWSLRMRFAPGVRLPKNFAAYWTDSKVGTIDDVVQTNAGNDLRENIYATVALATSARVLRAVDPPLAVKALKAAEEDYAEFLPSLTKPIRPITYGDAERGSWRDVAAYLTVVAIELYRATGKISYRADSLRFGGWLIALQEQSFVDGSPVTGYFYADPERTQIQREVYGGGDDSGFLALRALCEEFPDDPGLDALVCRPAHLFGILLSRRWPGLGAFLRHPYGRVAAERSRHRSAARQDWWRHGRPHLAHVPHPDQRGSHAKTASSDVRSRCSPHSRYAASRLSDLVQPRATRQYNRPAESSGGPGLRGRGARKI